MLPWHALTLLISESKVCVCVCGMLAHGLTHWPKVTQVGGDRPRTASPNLSLPQYVVCVLTPGPPCPSRRPHPPPSVPPDSPPGPYLLGIPYPLHTHTQTLLATAAQTESHPSVPLAPGTPSLNAGRRKGCPEKGVACGGDTGRAPGGCTGPAVLTPPWPVDAVPGTTQEPVFLE